MKTWKLVGANILHQKTPDGLEQKEILGEAGACALEVEAAVS